MIDISIKKLERNLGKRIKKNVFCVGVDTAATTGICLLTINDKEAHFEWELFKLPSLPRKIADQMEKAEKYEQQLDSMLMAIKDVKENHNLTCHAYDTRLVIEQSYLFNNPETFGILRAEQGIVYTLLHDYFKEVKIWLPTVVRNMVGYNSPLSARCPKDIKKAKYHQMKKQEIVKWVNNVLGTAMSDDNLADSTILALAGIIA